MKYLAIVFDGMSGEVEFHVKEFASEEEACEWLEELAHSMTNEILVELNPANVKRIKEVLGKL